MGLERPFEKEKLICGVLFPENGSPPLAEARLQMEASFGPLDFASEPYSFSRVSPYYDGEMGGSVRRVFWSFREPIDPARLWEVKRFTNRLETAFAGEGGRRINLDPGTLGPGKLILATTKPAAHRIALRDGIYAELTLFYARGDFQVLPWTYLDFRMPEVRTSLRRIRDLYMAQRRAGITKEE